MLAATLIERHPQLELDPRITLPVDEDRRIVGIFQRRHRVEAGEQIGRRRIDIGIRPRHLGDRRDHLVIVVDQFERAFERFGRNGRLDRLEIDRGLADDRPEIGDRSLVIGLRLGEIGARLRQPRLGLAGIGSGGLADPAPLARGDELLLEAGDIATGGIEHLLVAQEIGIDRDPVEQEVAGGEIEDRLFPLGLVARASHRGLGTAAAIDVLFEREGNLAGLQIVAPVLLPLLEREVGVAGRALDDQARAIAATGDGDILLDRAQLTETAIEARAGEIGRGENVPQPPGGGIRSEGRRRQCEKGGSTQEGTLRG